MTLDEIDKKMVELAKFALPGKNYNEEKAHEYYEIKKLYLVEKNKVNKIYASKNQEQRKAFVNGFGEATTREITNQTYKNIQNRLNREILSFIM